MSKSRRSILKYLGSFTVGILLANQAEAEGENGKGPKGRCFAPSRLRRRSARSCCAPPGASDRLGKLLPQRILGRMGEAVTMLGGGWHLGAMSERDAQETIEISLQSGVRFFYTAESYQSGGSETRLGKLLTPKYRDVIYLMTKSTARNADEARRHLEKFTQAIKYRLLRSMASTLP